ncbi:MAG TPA: type II secretion system protein [Pyrinomonadaceae bacterium]
MNFRNPNSPFYGSVVTLPPNRQREEGYTLVALLAFMTILAIFAMAAAPKLSQQAQREQEKEAIFRGEQVADAIQIYYKAHGTTVPQSLPTSIDQLLEGIPRGTKKVQILRPSAARDALSTSGEWRLIAPQSQDLLDFERSVSIYAGGVPPRPRDSAIAGLQDASVPRLVDVLNTGSTETAPGGQDTSPGSSGPFVGVASRSRRNSVINYYGIDRHDQWIFTPLFR